MNIELLAVSVVPIVLYVFVDTKYGMKAGIITSLLSVITLGIYFFYRIGKFDYLFLFDGGLLVALGLLSIHLNNSKLFKLQPTIVGLLISVYLAYLQFFQEPIMIRMLPMMDVLAPEQANVFKTLGGMTVLGHLSLVVLVCTTFHAVLVGYAAVKCSNIAWLVARLSIYPILIIATMATFSYYRHLLF